MENMLCFTFSPLAVGKKNLGHWMNFFSKKLEMSMFHHWWWNVFKAHFCVRMFWGEHSHRCAVCVGHCLLCEMTLISLLPNLAGSISPAIIGERGREDGWGGRKGWEGCSCSSSAYHPAQYVCVRLNTAAHSQVYVGLMSGASSHSQWISVWLFPVALRRNSSTSETKRESAGT